MENVGESNTRNREFDRKFSREALIRGLIAADAAAPLVVDVGAHKGESAKFLRSLFPRATIHSFEPLPASFETLRALSDERTLCHNLALTDVDGSVEFFGNAISHTNSIFRVNTQSRDSLFFEQRRKEGQQVPQGMFNAPMTIASMRLDTFCTRAGIDRIDLLKLDVQGAERRVLDGAGAMLARTDNIILEIMFFDYYEHQGSFLEIESVLQPAGFRLFSISEISNNPMNGRTDWAEVIYRRAVTP